MEGYVAWTIEDRIGFEHKFYLLKGRIVMVAEPEDEEWIGNHIENVVF